MLWFNYFIICLIQHRHRITIQFLHFPLSEYRWWFLIKKSIIQNANSVLLIYHKHGLHNATSTCPNILKSTLPSLGHGRRTAKLYSQYTCKRNQCNRSADGILFDLMANAPATKRKRTNERNCVNPEGVHSRKFIYWWHAFKMHLHMQFMSGFFGRLFNYAKYVS